MTEPHKPQFNIQESQPERAMDLLTREVPFAEAADFVGACSVFTEVIAKEHPDIVFFPQRGAGPIEWTTQALIEASGESMPKFIDLPIGTHIKINDDKPRYSGISGSEKRELILQTIRDLHEDGTYVPNKSRIMLIDEVQKGGTIGQAAQAIHDAMLEFGDNNSLNIVAAQDSRHNMIGDSRKDSYKKLVANERKGFKTTAIPTAMFMVDRPQFLDEIWQASDHDFATLEDYVINNNESARRLFRTLAAVYLDPDKALVELDELHLDNLASDLGQTVLQTEILDAMTDPRPVRNKKKQATDMHLFNWWHRYARSIKNHRYEMDHPMKTFEPVQ